VTISFTAGSLTGPGTAMTLNNFAHDAGGTPTTGLLGDLSFLHDLSGLLLARRLDRPCIVLNNGGGRIFDYLPQRGFPGFDALWRTPVELDLGALARTFGIAHREAGDGAGFGQALADSLGAPPGGVIEVHIDAERSRRVHLDFWRRIREEDLLQD
jgi:2-succinyl-5-enolpyruvyl-6-hydroxy-3-cyclohexene-1-carboxylate synthase